MIDTKAIRSKILDLALRGKLTEQLSGDGTAEELYQQIQQEKQALIKSGKIKKEKPLPEIAETEIPFEIPDSWKWVRLGLLSNQITDGTHKTPTYVKEGIPFLSVKNISAGCLDLTDIKFIPQNEHEELIKRCRPEKNDILFCRIGTLGRALRIDTDLEFSIFVSLGLIKTDNEELSNHIVYVINSEYGSNWIQSVKAGGAMHAYKINLTDLNMFPIPLPPFAELERIAEKIEQAFSVLDTIDKLQAKYADNLTALKSKLIDLAIRGKLTEQLPEDGTAEELYQQIQEEKQALIKSGKIKKEKPLPEVIPDEIPFEIPDNWFWCRLQSIFNFIDYRGATPEKITEGVPFVTAKNVRQGYIDYSISEFISEQDYQKRQSRGVSHKGDLLFTTEAPMGYAAIADLDRFSAGQRLITLQQYTDTSLLDNKYYMYVLSGKLNGGKNFKLKVA
ncbi:MAG: restriction endonuclease subunit S [Spirochaetales bacterium]|nr:restriction endonuclease subunit S [Spirochaetales bacterium]